MFAVFRCKYSKPPTSNLHILDKMLKNLLHGSKYIFVDKVANYVIYLSAVASWDVIYSVLDKLLFSSSLMLLLWLSFAVELSISDLQITGKWIIVSHVSKRTKHSLPALNCPTGDKHSLQHP